MTQLDKKPVLEVNHATVEYATRTGLAKAVDDVSLTIYENEVFGLIGESGCGKSTLANAIMRLLGRGAYLTSGTIKVLGQDVYDLKGEGLRQFRWTNMSMVFQSAMNVLNPVKNIESQIVDTLLAHRPKMSKADAKARAVELFRLVHIDPKRLQSFPHELSGGMRQRVVIAIAVALEPKLVIMDEPTTALDVVVQKSILEQMMKLKEQVGFSILFISHDFHLVSNISHRLGVMYAGKLVEVSQAAGAWSESVHHPYTHGLIRAVPNLIGNDDEIFGIPGVPPSPMNKPSGCAFHPRCPHATPTCLAESPVLTSRGASHIDCHLTTEELEELRYVK